ncbi:carbohydrate binding domain-containing protein [Paenibacillus mesophilus]|uniref:carbohydrate binding domain-containing protein n=1 Tax=Paenibacillus mesophilus TaxID=2582849 RepID=UPI0013054406|nr:carbohydrate binding domain-containing protein [Paenibacillus mesophilus]
MAFGIESAKIPILAGESYTASVKMKLQKGVMALYLRYYDANDRLLSAQPAPDARLGPLEQWITASVTATAPPGAAKAAILLYSSIEGVTIGHFDNVNFQRNFSVMNAGFEAPRKSDGTIANWRQALGSSGISLSQAIRSTGNLSLQITDTSTTEAIAAESEKIRITGGQIYRTQLKMFITSGTYSVYIRYYDEYGKVFPQTTNYKVFNSPANEWTTATVDVTAPSNAKTAAVMIASGAASVGTAYFDDVSFSLNQPLKISISEAQDLGEPVQTAMASGAAIGVNAAGQNELYFVVNGKPGVFYAMDAEHREIRFSKPLPGNEDTVWGITIGSDKNVYLTGTTTNALYRYDPISGSFESVGNHPGDKFIFELEASGDGKIYGASYMRSKVFEYDIAKKSFKDFGSIDPKQEYARSLYVHNDYVYVGIGTEKHLYRISRADGSKKEIMLRDTGTNGFVYAINEIEGKLLVSYGPTDVYNTATGQFIKKISFAGDPSPVPPASSGMNPSVLYYFNKGTLYSVDFFKPGYPERTVKSGISISDSLRMNWIELSDGRTVLVGLTQTLDYFMYNPSDDSIEVYNSIAPAQGVIIRTLEAGDDKNLYVGGFSKGFSVFNPDKKVVTMTNPYMEQVEGIGMYSGKAFLGTYGSAKIYQYDSAQIDQKAVTAAENPSLVYDIQNNQERPFVIVPGQRSLYVGTIPEYGKLGGALTSYNEELQQWTTYENIVPNQSITGLAYYKGKIFGGTSIWGGLGISPTETEAKIFVLDAATDKVIRTLTPQIPYIDTAPKKIGGLSVGPDGLLWGIIDGTIFAMNPNTYEVVKSKMIYNSTYANKTMPNRLIWGQDGLLYTTLSDRLTIIDPETLAYKRVLENISNVTVIDNHVYYSYGSHLYKITTNLIP